MSFVLPKTADELIDMLDTRVFPLRNMPATATTAEVQRHYGTRDAIDFLRSLQRERDAAIHERSNIDLGDDY